MDKLLEKKTILGREGWKFYKDNCNKQSRTKKINRDTHPKIVSAIFKKAAERMIENKSGVFLEGIGYFCIMMYPKRMMIRKPYSKTGEKYYNAETDHRVYSPQWIHGMYPHRYNIWTLDRTFSESSIKDPLCAQLRAGKKYVMEYELIKSLKKSNTRNK